MILLKVMTPRLAAWMDHGKCTGPTHQELMECLDGRLQLPQGRKGNQGGADNLASVTRLVIVSDSGGISTQWHERDGHC